MFSSIMFEGLTSKARPFSAFFICPRCVSMFEGIASFSLGCTWFPWIAFGKLHLLGSQWLHCYVGWIYFHGLIRMQMGELCVAFQLAPLTEIWLHCQWWCFIFFFIWGCYFFHDVTCLLCRLYAMPFSEQSYPLKPLLTLLWNGFHSC